MANSTSKPSQRPWPIVATIITLVAVVIMFALGIWQWQRAEQKTQRLQQIEQRNQVDPITIANLMNLTDDIRDLPFVASGRLEQRRYFLIDNRVHQGKVGYEVLALLNTDSGVLLVNLGWVKGSMYRDALPEIELPTELLTLDGIASKPSLNPMIQETIESSNQWPKVIQQLDFTVVNELLEDEVLDVVMLLSPDYPISFSREWKPVVMPPEKHIAYAIQWFGLGIACFIIYIFAIRAQKRRTHD